MTGRVYWMTGLPCSGKTTLAKIICGRLKCWTDNICHLDGDVLRGTAISEGLTFSPEDRETNLLRAATIAKLLALNGTHVFASFITPYNAIRDKIRAMMEEAGVSFTLIYVRAPKETCMERDVKGMWQKARVGTIRGFTGWDAPFEEPGSHDGNIHVIAYGANPHTTAEDLLRQIEWPLQASES